MGMTRTCAARLVDKQVRACLFYPTLGLQVCKEQLLLGPKYLGRTHFGLLKRDTLGPASLGAF